MRFPLVAAQVEADEVPATIHGKPVRVDRVWRQVRDGLDRDRLLPADDKRRRDLAKRLDKPLDRNGWRMFAAGCAWTVENGKATQRRNAEIQLVEAVARWTADVARRCASFRQPACRLCSSATDGGALSRAYLVDLASGAERRALAWALRDDGDRPLPAARCREAAAALTSVTPASIEAAP